MTRAADGLLAGRPAAWLAALLTVGAVVVAGCTARGDSPAGPVTATSSITQTGSPARTLSDVAYANASPEEKLDLYLPPGTSTPAPLVIWIHGGGWHAGSREAIHRTSPSPGPRPTTCTQRFQVQSPVVAQLTGHGYAVASIDYRLDRNPGHALEDAKAAVRHLRANAATYHLDPDRFAAWGNSAGGWTAVMLGLTGDRRTAFDNPALGHPTTSSAVQAVVDWYGPTDPSPFTGPVGADDLPSTYIRAGQRLPPFRIAHGSADCTVPVEESRRLYRALTAAGDPATLSILSGAYHEDPAFMRTELVPTLTFLDDSLDHSVDHSLGTAAPAH